MPKSGRVCCVVGCSNTYHNTEGKGIKFYSFPGRPHEQERRQKWITITRRINEDGTPWQPTKNSRVCSEHFISKMKNEHPAHTDYVPTVFPKLYSKKNADGTERFHRLQKRKKIGKRQNEGADSEINPPQIEAVELPFIDKRFEDKSVQENGTMRLKINLNNYCRLCAAGDGQLLACDEVLFEEASSKTTIKEMVQMNIPDIFKENETILLPKGICVQCVKIILNWGDFVKRSLNSNNYFTKLLSRDFELPKDNVELVTFISETKNDFSLKLERYHSKLASKLKVLFDSPTSKKKGRSDSSTSRTLIQVERKTTSLEDEKEPTSRTLIQVKRKATSLEDKKEPTSKTLIQVERKTTSLEDEKEPTSRTLIQVKRKATSFEDKKEPTSKTLIQVERKTTSLEDEKEPTSRTLIQVKRKATSLEDKKEPTSKTLIQVERKTTSLEDEKEPTSRTLIQVKRKATSFEDKKEPTSKTLIQVERKTTSLEDEKEPTSRTLIQVKRKATSLEDKKEPTSKTLIQVERNKTSLEDEKESSEIKKLGNESDVKHPLIYASTPPVKRNRQTSRFFGKRRKRSNIDPKKSCEYLMCSSSQLKMHQEYGESCTNSYQTTSNNHKSPPKTSLESLNSSTPEKLICSPTIMMYQEEVDANQPIVNKDANRTLDVNNLVDGSTEWVYLLKENELAYVLESYNLNTEGSFTTLQKRLINHLKQIDEEESQLPTSDSQQINNDDEADDDDDDDEESCGNDSESDLEVTEVPPDPNCGPVVRDHPYAKKAPAGYFKLEDVLFRPRGRGSVNMQFFIAMASDWTEELFLKMSSSEIMCILEICNIEREGSTTEQKKKLIRYLAYIKDQSTAVPEDSNNEKDAGLSITASEGGLTVSENTLFSTSDQSDETPFRGFESTVVRNNVSENLSDQSDKSPFRGFESTYISNAASPDQTDCQKSRDSCLDIHHVKNIKTEVDTLYDGLTEYQNMEVIIKEENPESPAQENSSWMNSDHSSQYSDGGTYTYVKREDLPPVNHGIHSELIEYFRTYNIMDDVNKYKCCVVVEKLHPADISSYCSSAVFLSPDSSTCSASSATLTCSPPYLFPCSPPSWTPYCNEVSTPAIEYGNTGKIFVRKFEDLC